MDNLDQVEDTVQITVRGELVTLHYSMATARWFQTFTKKSFLGGWAATDPVEVLTALYVGCLKERPEWGLNGKPTKAKLDEFISEVEQEKSVKQWLEMLPLILKALGVEKDKSEGEEDPEGKI